MNDLVLVGASNVSDNTPSNEAPAPVEVKRGRGRPQVYTGAQRLYIIALIGVHGLTKTQRLLNSTGAVRKAYARKLDVNYDALAVICPHKPHKMNISMLKLHQLGREGGLTLTRGRPKTKVAVVAVVAETKAAAQTEAAAEVADAPIAG